MEKTPISQGNTWNTSGDIEAMGTGGVDSLKEAIEEVDELIRKREILSQRFLAEGEKMKTKINNFLSESAPKGDDDSEFARERAELRKKQIEISEMQLNETVGAWRDIALLKKELRDRTKELHEKTSRAEALGRIMEGE
ncbi:MAG: hypothetical protein NUV97_00275 [archaeon]|nr:hypothetical protein [archaeon]MCR4323612.1 hypothetical protein [Nanoarchaeota archaeon]